MTYPIPSDAFDDRLAFVGTSGSGKTYATLGALARLLKMSGSRMIGVDALGVMWGLRLLADGKTSSGLDIVIFGGPHGDLPIHERAGALIGETVSTMRESVILDLSELGSDVAERRFMLAFLTALYRNLRKDLTHLVFDEADMWAPQLILDREGDAMKLLSMMKTIVRRGRVKGFIPWLITQRPAELSKSVLSMMDGIIAMGMTGAQDRDAIGAWIKGQADVATGRAILDSLPGKQIGEGVVWIPRRKILVPEARFPENRTFDSSRAPKRGEKLKKIDLPPLNLTKLQERMATIVEESKVNDPADLRRQLARAQAEIAKLRKSATSASPDHKALEQAVAAARADGISEGMQLGWEANADTLRPLIRDFGQRLVQDFEAAIAVVPKASGAMLTSTAPGIIRFPSVAKDTPAPSRRGTSRRTPGARPSLVGADSLTGPQETLLRVLSWWSAMGHEAPTRAQVAAVAGWKITAGHLNNVSGQLRSAGFIDYPRPSAFALTDEGRRRAPAPDMGATLLDGLASTLTGSQNAVLNVLLKNGRRLSKLDLCNHLQWNPTAGHVNNVLGAMRTLQIIDYPERGVVELRDWVM